MLKNKKHDIIINDYENIKRKHLIKLANLMLVNQEKFVKLKNKHISDKFLKNF